jgi:hypothetical protein
MERLQSHLSAEDRRLIKQDLEAIRLAACRLAAIEAMRRRQAPVDGPLVRAARAVERALGIGRG